MLGPYFLSDQVRRGYHSGLKGEAIPADAIMSESTRKVQDKVITLETTKYTSPRFKITIRSSVNHWQDHEGTFADGKWTFVLSAGQYADTFDMKFVLLDVDADDPAHALGMIGKDVTIAAWQAYQYFTDASVLFAYSVSFRTDLWQPSHCVTLRNEIDGWGRDIYGVFRNNRWSFHLDRAHYPSSFVAKFVLDRFLFMEGDDLTISSAQTDYQWDDSRWDWCGRREFEI